MEDATGKIRVNMSVSLLPDMRMLRAFRLFDPGDFLVAPVTGGLMWFLGGRMMAKITKVVIDPEAPLVAIACEVMDPVEDDAFKELIYSGWERMFTKAP